MRLYEKKVVPLRGQLGACCLLVILGLGVLDAGVLGIARQRVASFLRDLILRVHLRVARARNGVAALFLGLGVSDRRLVLRVGLLHAYVLVVALLRLAGV